MQATGAKNCIYPFAKTTKVGAIVRLGRTMVQFVSVPYVMVTILRCSIPVHLRRIMTRKYTKVMVVNTCRIVTSFVLDLSAVVATVSSGSMITVREPFVKVTTSALWILVK